MKGDENDQNSLYTCLQLTKRKLKEDEHLNTNLLDSFLILKKKVCLLRKRIKQGLDSEHEIRTGQRQKQWQMQMQVQRQEIPRAP